MARPVPRLIDKENIKALIWRERTRAHHARFPRTLPRPPLYLCQGHRTLHRRAMAGLLGLHDLHRGHLQHQGLDGRQETF